MEEENQLFSKISSWRWTATRLLYVNNHRIM